MTETTKICTICNVPKAIDAFYTHPKTADGRLGKCKDCCKKQAKDRRKNKQEEIRAYEKGRSNLPHRVAAREKYFKEHQSGEEHLARRCVSNALRDGRLAKLPCAVCGGKKVEAHHEDYEKPLEVIWLCKQHHVEVDKKRRSSIARCF